MAAIPLDSATLVLGLLERDKPRGLIRGLFSRGSDAAALLPERKELSTAEAVRFPVMDLERVKGPRALVRSPGGWEAANDAPPVARAGLPVVSLGDSQAF